MKRLIITLVLCLMPVFIWAGQFGGVVLLGSNIGDFDEKIEGIQRSLAPGFDASILVNYSFLDYLAFETGVMYTIKTINNKFQIDDIQFLNPDDWSIITGTATDEWYENTTYIEIPYTLKISAFLDGLTIYFIGGAKTSIWLKTYVKGKMKNPVVEMEYSDTYEPKEENIFIGVVTGLGTDIKLGPGNLVIRLMFDNIFFNSGLYEDSKRYSFTLLAGYGF